MAYFLCPLTPVSSRLRFGEIKPAEKTPIDLTEGFIPGQVGLESTGKIVSKQGEEGYMALIRQPLLPGRYRIDFTVRKKSTRPSRIVFDVAIDEQPVAHVVLPKLSLGQVSRSITFESGIDAMFGGFFECRLWVDGNAIVTLERASLLPD